MFLDPGNRDFMDFPGEAAASKNLGSWGILLILLRLPRYCRGARSKKRPRAPETRMILDY